MHLYFCGIGGSGLSSLAHIALDCGFSVSGSDKVGNQNIQSLQRRGANIHVGQSGLEIELTHKKKPIYWVIQSSSIPANHPEIVFTNRENIKLSKRDVFINFILKKDNLKLLAICGTHGKTTTSAMPSWLFYKLNIPASWVIGSNISFGNSGQFEPKSKYLILEADEFDRNFLAFTPDFSLLTSLDYDHPDTYKTQEDYFGAFREFLDSSNNIVVFNEDLKKLRISSWQPTDISDSKITQLKRFFGGKVADYNTFELFGLHNRQNAALVKTLFNKINLELKLEIKPGEIEQILSTFPGTTRRMEKLATNLYTDYAHHPAEIAATLELASEFKQNIVVVFEPHQNLRQHLIFKDYFNCFNLAKKVYWLPTFLTRENPDLKILTPTELIANLENPEIAEISSLDNDLKNKLQNHLLNHDLVVVMGAGDVDNWVRRELLV